MPNFNEHSNPFLNTQRAIQNVTERGSENDLSKINQNSNGLAVTFTNVYIRANNVNVGMIQSFTVQENRQVNKLQSIGVEGVIQAVPQNTEGGTIQAQRVALYGERLYDAFKVKSSTKANGSKKETTIFKTLKDQRTPFEIQVLTVAGGNSNGEPKFYTETYTDCWISNYSKSYTTSNITVSENVSMRYSDVL